MSNNTNKKETIIRNGVEFTRTTKDQVILMHYFGCPVKDLAESFKISESTVRRWIKQDEEEL